MNDKFVSTALGFLGGVAAYGTSIIFQPSQGERLLGTLQDRTRLTTHEACAFQPGGKFHRGDLDHFFGRMIFESSNNGNLQHHRYTWAAWEQPILDRILALYGRA